MRLPPTPSTVLMVKGGDIRAGLTRSLLDQHDAFQAIDEGDEGEKKKFVKDRVGKVRCNLCYNLKSIWSHRPQT